MVLEGRGLRCRLGKKRIVGFRKNFEGAVILEKINFMLAGDNNYINQMIVAMTSIVVNHPIRKVSFHLFVNRLSKADENKLISSGSSKNSEVVIYNMEDYLHHFTTINPSESHNPHVSMASNYRLIMTEVLPKNLTKCFYVDSDMVVDTDLSNIYDSMKADELAMVVSEIHSMEFRESVLSRLNNWEEFSKFKMNPLEYPYFNAGFFLLNVDLARKVGMFSRILNFISKHDFIPYTDQDILNAVIGQERPGKVIFLPPHYNVFWNTDHYYSYTRTYYASEQILDSFDNPKVIHFCGPWKPWDCGGWPHYDFWWKYAEMSSVAKEFFVNDKRRLSDIAHNAMRFHYNWGVEKNLHMALESYSEIIKEGIGQAVPYAIDVAKEIGDMDGIRELAPYAATEAEKGNGDCAVRLGQAYRDGQGVEWNLDKAEYWFRKAYNLNIFWCKPELYDVLKWQCDERNKSMFEVASSGAEDGNAMSMVQLGRCYRDGIGTDSDPQKAKQWFSKAAEESNLESIKIFIKLPELPLSIRFKALWFLGLNSMRKKGVCASIRHFFSECKK